jgi:hypothetical protein
MFSRPAQHSVANALAALYVMMGGLTWVASSKRDGCSATAMQQRVALSRSTVLLGTVVDSYLATQPIDIEPWRTVRRTPLHLQLHVTFRRARVIPFGNPMRLQWFADVF